MKKLLLLTSFICFSLASSAQFIEFGGGIGASHYTGDLNSYPRVEHSHLAATGIYRLNFSPIVSMKFALTFGKISGDDSHPVDALGEQRQYSFQHSFFELSSVFEYHFLDYRPDNNMRLRWSPYAFLGFGLMNLGNTEPAYEDYSRFQAVIPMGAGVKYLLSKRLTLGLEAGARKTFFDYLDGLSDGDQTIKNYQYGNPNDKDWYFYTGISLTFVLYEVPCPFPYVPNQSIFTRIRPH